MLYIVRGLPGSGKTTYVEEKMKEQDFHFEADMFFLNDAGEYVFDRTKLKEAHQWCKDNVRKHLPPHDVWVSNTFVERWEFADYFDMVKELNVPFMIIEMNGKFKSVHDVPEEKIRSMEQRFAHYSEVESMIESLDIEHLYHGYYILLED